MNIAKLIFVKKSLVRGIHESILQNGIELYWLSVPNNSQTTNSLIFSYFTLI